MARTVNADQHRAKRRMILHAAARLFANQGFHGTSTAQICQAAGISSGNLFHYFPSKRALFAELIAGEGADDEDSRAAVADAYDATDPLEGLLGFADHLVAGAAQPVVPGLVVEAMLQAGRDPDLAALMEDSSNSDESHVTRLLRKAREAGAIDPNLDLGVCAGWIMTLVGALYLHAATNPDSDPDVQRTMLRRTLQRYIQP